jgi:hypothetical protein
MIYLEFEQNELLSRIYWQIFKRSIQDNVSSKEISQQIIQELMDIEKLGRSILR